MYHLANDNGPSSAVSSSAANAGLAHSRAYQAETIGCIFFRLAFEIAPVEITRAAGRG